MCVNVEGTNTLTVGLVIGVSVVVLVVAEALCALVTRTIFDVADWIRFQNAIRCLYDWNLKQN